MKQKQEIKLKTQWSALWIAIMVCFLFGQASSFLPKSETGLGIAMLELIEFPAAEEAENSSVEESETFEKEHLASSLFSQLYHSEISAEHYLFAQDYTLTTHLELHTPPPELL